MIKLGSAVISTLLVIICLERSSFARTSQYPYIPCPGVFQYMPSGNANIGIITVKDVSYGKTTVSIELSQHGAMNTNNPGQMSLNFNKDEVFDYLNAGTPFTYRVDFPDSNYVPRVTSIRVNGQQICSGPGDSPPSTTMKLEYTINAFSSGSFSREQQPSALNMRRSWPNFNQQNYPSHQNVPSPQTFPNYPPFPRQTNPSFRQSYPNQMNNPAPRHLPSQHFHRTVSNPHSNNKNNNQPESQFEANPRNPFFSKPNIIGTPPTPIKPVEQPIQRPAIDPRNVEVTPTQVTTPPPTTTTTTTTTTAKPKTINPASFEYINSICGRENLNNIDMQKLNVKGQVISKSRFPWIVAVFQKNNKYNNFKCGGNLISTRTVVSAAHCFYNGFEILKPEEVMVSMGRHNLTETLDSSNIDAERIIQHPDYRPTLINFDADIAIVRLKQSVVFTVAIRPICMWQGAVDSRELEGVSGIIVGWGGDGRRNTTTVPTLVNATVVSEITCLRSNDVFISLTSNRTLCAGNLDGSGPCMGDSGNGLMIRNRNKWMLRGTVSAALGTAARPCMLDQYAIYSDIAMFVEWIRLNMLL